MRLVCVWREGGGLASASRVCVERGRRAGREDRGAVVSLFELFIRFLVFCVLVRAGRHVACLSPLMAAAETVELRALEAAQLEEHRGQRQVFVGMRAELDVEFTNQTCRLQQAYEVCWSECFARVCCVIVSEECGHIVLFLGALC